MGKKLDAQIKQQSRYYWKRRKEPFRNPYDCPACYASGILRIKRIKQDADSNVWLCVCTGCELKKVIVLPKIYELIDVYTKLCDELRKPQTGVEQ